MWEEKPQEQPTQCGHFFLFLRGGLLRFKPTVRFYPLPILIAIKIWCCFDIIWKHNDKTTCVESNLYSEEGTTTKEVYVVKIQPLDRCFTPTLRYTTSYTLAKLYSGFTSVSCHPRICLKGFFMHRQMNFLEIKLSVVQSRVSSASVMS